MKAIVQTAYGPAQRVLELREIGIPKPKRGQVLVRVKAASVHPDVWHEGGQAQAVDRQNRPARRRRRSHPLHARRDGGRADRRDAGVVSRSAPGLC
jgi:hypothetical protein